MRYISARLFKASERINTGISVQINVYLPPITVFIALLSLTSHKLYRSKN
jgi:hypothetical protein